MSLPIIHGFSIQGMGIPNDLPLPLLCTCVVGRSVTSGSFLFRPVHPFETLGSGRGSVVEDYSSSCSSPTRGPWVSVSEEDVKEVTCCDPTVSAFCVTTSVV